MDWKTLLLPLAGLFGGYIFICGFLKKINGWYYVSSLGKRKEKLPPGDMGWPFLGNMPSFLRAFKSTDPDSFLNNLAKRYGRTGIYKTHMYGSPCIIVYKPEVCKNLLNDHEKVESGYPTTTGVLFGRSLNGYSNDERKRLRHLTFSPINGQEALSLCIDNMEQSVISSLDEWARKEKIEFYTECIRMAYNIISHILFGFGGDESVNDEVAKLYEEIRYGFHSVAINLPGFAFHKAVKARKELVNVLKGVLDDRKKNGKRNSAEGRKSIMEVMMEIEDEDGKRMEDEHIVDLLLSYMFAGHESTGRAIMWVIINIEQYPEVLRKAKEEQEEILRRRPHNQKGLSFNEIKQMTYAQKMIDETLRQVGTPVTIFRKMKTDVTVSGYLIPKGWRVLIWPRGVYMDPEIYKNPKEYKPERWDGPKPKPGSFMPFGGGTWRCPGADMAKFEIFIFLHYYLLNYKLERLNPNCPLMNIPIKKPIDNCLARLVRLYN